MTERSTNPETGTPVPLQRLGLTDMHITRVGFGAWAIGGAGWVAGWGRQDDSASIASIRHAIHRGINWIDTAAVYGLGHSEQIVRQALTGIPVSERPFVFTKCGIRWDETDRMAMPKKIGAAASIRGEAEASLRRLGVERIDLYQMHWPPDDGTPLEAYWQTLLDLKAEGKVRAVGLSNHDAAQLEAAERLGHVDTLQPPFSAIHRDVATAELPWCRAHDTGVIVYSPMASGLLTGAFTVERAKSLPKDDWRSRSADFTGDVLIRNLKVVKCDAADRGATWHQRRERCARMDLGMARCDRRHRRRPQSGAGRRMVRCGYASPHARRPPEDRRRDCRGRRRQWPHPSGPLTLR